MAMQDLTRGPVRGHLLRMSGFMLATMLVQSLYSLIDLFWVGRLGPQAIAAVSLGSNLMMAVMAFAQVLAVGVAALVSQAMGRQDKPAVRTMFNQSMLLSVGGGLLFGGTMWAGRGLYADALSGDAETARLMRDFLFWFMPALALQMPAMVLTAALRGVGNVKIASVMQVATVLMNIVLAPILIFGWGIGQPLGVAGAALATLISVALGLAAMLVHVARSGNFFDASATAWRPQLPVWKRMTGIGLPSGIEFALMGLYLICVTALLRPFGSAPQAAFGIGMRFLQLGMMPSMSVCFAAAAIVGQSFGARMPERIAETWKRSMQLSIGGCMIFVLSFHLLPTWLFGLFTADAEVIRHGIEFLRLLSWNLLASGLVFACLGVFSGLGNTRPSLIGSATRVALILIPAAALSHLPGFVPVWIWWLSVFASSVQALMNLWFLRRRLADVHLVTPAPRAA